MLDVKLSYDREIEIFNSREFHPCSYVFVAGSYSLLQPILPVKGKLNQSFTRKIV